jgi:hypothetical protein
MATVQFRIVDVPFGSSVSANGTITADAQASFSTNVISAGVAIQGWTLSYGKDDNWVKDAGANIYNVQTSGTSVLFTASLQLIDDSGNKLNPADVSLTALVIAYLE